MVSNYEYEIKFNTLFSYQVQKELLRFCIYSISRHTHHLNLEKTYEGCSEVLPLFYHYQDVYQLTEHDKCIVVYSSLMRYLGSWFRLEDYHVIGYGLVYDYLSRFCPHYFTEKETHHIARCVLEHAGDSRYPPSDILSEIVYVGNFGIPDITNTIKRYCDNTAKNEGNLNRDIYHYLIEEFGEKGSFWNSYPALGLQFYCEEWDEFKCILNDSVKVNSIISLFD